jgi:hypothetical protein
MNMPEANRTRSLTKLSTSSQHFAHASEQLNKKKVVHKRNKSRSVLGRIKKVHVQNLNQQTLFPEEDSRRHAKGLGMDRPNTRDMKTLSTLEKNDDTNDQSISNCVIFS